MSKQEIFISKEVILRHFLLMYCTQKASVPLLSPYQDHSGTEVQDLTNPFLLGCDCSQVWVIASGGKLLKASVPASPWTQQLSIAGYHLRQMGSNLFPTLHGSDLDWTAFHNCYI